MKPLKHYTSFIGLFAIFYLVFATAYHYFYYRVILPQTADSTEQQPIVYVNTWSRNIMFDLLNGLCSSGKVWFYFVFLV